MSVHRDHVDVGLLDIEQPVGRGSGMIDYHQPKYDIRLNAFNLFDRKYFDALIQSDGGRSVPGTGRSAMLSISYHL